MVKTQSAERAAPRRTKKLDPDPAVRLTILAAASKIVREEGVRSLSVAQVLSRARLSTRAFYRHFDSKDQLVSAVFVDMARVEALRLRRAMSACAGPVEAVVAWIDGRLDLAFDEKIRSDLRKTSLEAQTQMFAAPELVSGAYAEILKPLVEQLARGQQLGIFPDIDPATDAQSIQGTVWAVVERQWATGDGNRTDIRRHAIRFCLGGLGVAHRHGE
jgi:AcrR family transcriptional regulator